MSQYIRLPAMLNTDHSSSIDEVIQQILSAEDSIELYCSGWGGAVFYMYQLINTIRYANENRELLLVVDSFCESAHANIAISATNIEIKDIGCYFMFHVGGGGFCNDNPAIKEIETRDFTLSVDREMDKLLGLFDIFSRRELKEYKKGHDVLIKGGEMKKRLTAIGKNVS